jgi:NAD(P)-dependent dehydrogenase (short-subunit alcohol dehydrogenase family)
MIDPGIKGRVAIVTGANQGIGAAAARALADQGVAVFLTYLRLGPDDPGVQATGLQTYALARAQAGEPVAEAIKGAGGRVFARRHVARGAAWGRIISLTTGGSGGFPREVSYGASKNALESYTVAAAWELGRYGITANVLCPPATDTGWMTPEMAEEIAKEGPLYHVGKPDEVAEPIVFLASHQARFITGQKITMHCAASVMVHCSRLLLSVLASASALNTKRAESCCACTVGAPCQRQ